MEIGIVVLAFIFLYVIVETKVLNALLRNNPTLRKQWGEHSLRGYRLGATLWAQPRNDRRTHAIVKKLTHA